MQAERKIPKTRAGADIVLECLRCAEGAGRSTRTVSADLSLRDIRDPRQRGLRHPAPSEWFGKDVKIVGTNSINFFRISESSKKRTENELETNSKMRRKQCNQDAKYAGWRIIRADMYAPGWSAPADGRIHRDKRRRDVFATQF